MTKNVLYYGDNLDILRRCIKDETIDLIYLDPPIAKVDFPAKVVCSIVKKIGFELTLFFW